MNTYPLNNHISEGMNESQKLLLQRIDFYLEKYNKINSQETLDMINGLKNCIKGSHQYEARNIFNASDNSVSQSFYCKFCDRNRIWEKFKD